MKSIMTLPTWLDADTKASECIAPIVGALPSEVAVMETLTANLHLLLSAFYKPDINGRHKIIIESQAFPSDHVRISFLFEWRTPDGKRSSILHGIMVTSVANSE